MRTEFYVFIYHSATLRTDPGDSLRPNLLRRSIGPHNRTSEVINQRRWPTQDNENYQYSKTVFSSFFYFHSLPPTQGSIGSREYKPFTNSILTPKASSSASFASPYVFQVRVQTPGFQGNHVDRERVDSDYGHPDQKHVEHSINE